MRDTVIPSIEIDWKPIREEMAQYIAREPEFIARLEQLRQLRDRLLPRILEQVKTWESYTFPAYDIDPCDYLLGGCAPGRRLKNDPGPKNGVVRYGLDADGRKVIERWPNTANVGEQLWEYHEDRIDGMSASADKVDGTFLSARAVETLFMEQGRPLWYFRHNDSSRCVRLFRYENDKIVQVLMAGNGTPISSMVKGRWSYGLATIEYNDKGDAQVRVFKDDQDHGWERICKSPKVSAARKRVPQLDLRKDISETVAAIRKAVEKFAARQSKSTGPVSGIGLGFFAFENPEVLIHFDTRPEFEPDGEWSHPEFARLKRPRWNRFIETCEGSDGKGTVFDAHGNRHDIDEISEETRIVPWLGEALVTALRTARDSGAFKPLKTAARCEIGVEEAGDGEFGWPNYEDRGKENLV